MTENKYKLFRNFMTNELGITREDIKAWTIEATSREVARIVGGLNLDLRVQELMHRQVTSAMTAGWSGGEPSVTLKAAMKASVAELVANRIKVILVPQTEGEGK